MARQRRARLSLLTGGLLAVVALVSAACGGGAVISGGTLGAGLLLAGVGLLLSFTAATQAGCGPLGPCLSIELPEDAGDVGPCLSIAPGEDGGDAIDAGPGPTDGGDDLDAGPIGPCLDVAPPEDGGDLGPCLSIAPPTDGGTDGGSALAPAPSHAERLAARADGRAQVAERLVEQGVLPADLAARLARLDDKRRG